MMLGQLGDPATVTPAPTASSLNHCSWYQSQDAAQQCAFDLKRAVGTVAMVPGTYAAGLAPSVINTHERFVLVSVAIWGAALYFMFGRGK